MSRRHRFESFVIINGGASGVGAATVRCIAALGRLVHGTAATIPCDGGVIAGGG